MTVTELTAPTVVLSRAETSVERNVVDEFARDLPVAHDPEEAVALARASGAPIAPVGVAWLPPEREGGRRVPPAGARGGAPFRAARPAPAEQSARAGQAAAAGARALPRRGR